MSNSLNLKIEILSYWHSGSGFSGGPSVDALVEKDNSGLPCLRGRTLKGLLREAMRTAEDFKAVDAGKTAELLGVPGSDGGGKLTFNDAVLPVAEQRWLAAPSQAAQREALFDYVSSTAINSDGVAEYSTLRSMELCVPVTLETVVEGPGSDWQKDLNAACGLVRHLGKNRNRGLGRCRVTVVE
jgi:hypothetical protein